MILLFQLSKTLSSLVIHILTAPYILFHKLYNFILSESFCLTYGIILTIRTLMHIYKKKVKENDLRHSLPSKNIPIFSVLFCNVNLRFNFN